MGLFAHLRSHANLTRDRSSVSPPRSIRQDKPLSSPHTNAYSQRLRLSDATQSTTTSCNRVELILGQITRVFFPFRFKTAQRSCPFTQDHGVMIDKRLESQDHHSRQSLRSKSWHSSPSSEFDRSDSREAPHSAWQSSSDSSQWKILVEDVSLNQEPPPINETCSAIPAVYSIDSQTNANIPINLALQNQSLLHVDNQQSAIDRGMLQTLLDALSNEDYEGSIAKLSAKDVKATAIALQLIIDGASTFGDTSAQRALTILIQIADSGGPLPPSLFTTNVSLTHGRHAAYFGGFSDVFKGKMESGEQVALKLIRIAATDRDKATIIRRIYKEALVWKQLRHPFVLSFVGIDMEIFGGHPTLVSPWMENGTILDYLQKTSPDSGLRLRMAAESAEGVAYLHDLGLVHGDIRGVNVFVSLEGKPRLADFGLSGLADSFHTATSEAKSSRWSAPELHQPRQFGFLSFKRTRETDVYAFAGLFLEIFTERPPFHDIRTEFAVSREIITGVRPANWPVNSVTPIPRQAWEVIEQCWSSVAADRPTIEAVLTALLEARSSSIKHSEATVDSESGINPRH